MHILMIDDDPEDSMLFCDAIKDIAPEHICHVANSCQLAKSLLEENEVAPDIIFLDAFMYPMGGKECLIQISQLEKLRDTRIIIHSGSLSPAQTEEFLYLGADQIMTKAKTYEALCKSLNEIFANK
jgi:CheY-like chemotaxis protein